MKKVPKFSPDEDASLLLAWHRGDISAFETLVWKYHKRVFSLAFYLTGNSEKAVAATQGAFIAAFVNINTFNSRYHFSNWLISLTLKETRGQYDDNGLVSSKAAAKDPGLQEQLSAQIRMLPVELAEILVLRYVRGYSLERLAEIYGLRSDVLITRLFAAHEMLAAIISQEDALPGQSLPGGVGKISPHPEIRLSFHAYLDSSLSREEAEKIKKHLKSCGNCREALTRLEWMIEHLNSLPDVDPPHLLGAAIMQNVKSSSAKPVSVRKTPSTQFLQLGVVLLLFMVIGISAYLLLNDHDIRSAAGPGKGAEPKQGKVPSPRPQQGKSAGPVTSAATPGSPGMPPVPVVRTTVSPVASNVPLPPVVLPAAPSPDLTASPESTPAAAPVKSEAAGKRDRMTRSPELPHEWGENLQVPGPQEK